MLLNTHHHGDHTGGNKAYGVSKIVAHENCLKSHRATTEKTADQQAYATQTFTDTWTEKFGNETIEGRYFGPGHTGGDIVYHFQQANVMHMGDLLFNRAHPNIDRAQGARIDNWITILETVVQARLERHHLHRRPCEGQRGEEHPCRADALPQLPDRGARSRPRRHQGGTVEGRNPEAACAERLRRQRLAECAADDGLRARHCATTNSPTRSHRTGQSGQQAREQANRTRNTP